ncbi:MAG: DUF86 domain-containing protein [Armatimonadetes bacterium]|nr:DUF86 domain-containing protein [Armatimonadota bacterium]
MNIRDIQRKLDVITDNLEKLEQLASKSFKDFTSDFRNIDSVLHRMQTSIQALLDIGSYVIILTPVYLSSYDSMRITDPQNALGPDGEYVAGRDVSQNSHPGNGQSRSLILKYTVD